MLPIAVEVSGKDFARNGVTGARPHNSKHPTDVFVNCRCLRSHIVLADQVPVGINGDETREIDLCPLGNTDDLWVRPSPRITEFVQSLRRQSLNHAAPHRFARRRYVT